MKEDRLYKRVRIIRLRVIIISRSIRNTFKNNIITTKVVYL